MAGENYEINYDDERFGQVEADKATALSDLENTYAGMVNNSDKYYQQQIDASKAWADKQSQIQQEQTDFTIEQIEQQKDQAKKDYTKEQSGAYVDWQKQSNQYGTEAERQASAGMTGTGYSESSQVSMYNAYQNRVAVAREAYSRAVLNYDNNIKEARLQNNAALAEIAAKQLEQELQLALEGFQYKNSLVLDLTGKKLEVDQMYYSRYQDVLAQINRENALAEEIRQYNESQALAREKFEEEKRQYNEQMALKTAKSSGGGGGIGGSSTSIKKSSSSSSASTKSSSGAKIDTKSVIDLGYGPISASNLANKVATGQVTATQTGNTISFKKSSNVNAAAQALLDKYTWKK